MPRFLFLLELTIEDFCGILFLSNCELEDRNMEDLVRKIQSMTLTRTDAEIAEYILAHLSTIGFQTGSEHSGEEIPKARTETSQIGFQ